jgi:SpoVK/Ycf46/Vps4 family AAA+-type ATPase
MAEFPKTPQPDRQDPTLDKLVGLASVKKTIRDYRNLIEVGKRRGQDLMPSNFVMIGNPGTGKTTVARIMARMFCDLGYLPTDKFVEARRDTLISEYLGQTGPKTQAVLESALGGTLFIDDAYTLAVRPKGQNWVDSYAKEAIDTLVPFMESNKGKLAVIVAGYEEEMQEFLNSNPVLRRRFTNFIHFPDYTPAECAQIFTRFIAQQQLTLTPEAVALIPDLFSKLCAAPNWLNAHDVRRFREFTDRAQAKRFIAEPDSDPASITKQDLELGIRDFSRTLRN